MKHILSLFFLLLFGSASTQTLPALPTKPKPTNFPEMIYVAEGSFGMGSNNSSDEKPVHTVSVRSFSIGKYEVTVAQYLFFCIATNRSMPRVPSKWNDKHPIVNVNYDDTNA